MNIFLNYMLYIYNMDIKLIYSVCLIGLVKTHVSRGYDIT